MPAIWQPRRLTVVGSVLIDVMMGVRGCRSAEVTSSPTEPRPRRVGASSC